MDSSPLVPLTSSTNGLRADKKRRTRERILANAIALFRKQGMRATRLAQIADESDVSSATLFNYFPTKGALAEAWVRGELESHLADAIEAAVDTRHNLRSAIRATCRGLAEASAVEPALRLDAWREAGRAPRDGLAATPGRVSRRAALVAGVQEEQAREHLRGDLAATTLCEMLLDAIEGGLVAGLEAAGDDAGAPKALARSLGRSAQARVDLVLDGARKRNERVELGARG